MEKVRQIMRLCMGVPGGHFGDEEANTEEHVRWIGVNLLRYGIKFRYGLFVRIKKRAEELAIAGEDPESDVVRAAARKVYQEYKDLACVVWSTFV
jgi:hypothetical protein